MPTIKLLTKYSLYLSLIIVSALFLFKFSKVINNYYKHLSNPKFSYKTFEQKHPIPFVVKKLTKILDENSTIYIVNKPQQVTFDDVLLRYYSYPHLRISKDNESANYHLWVKSLLKNHSPPEEITFETNNFYIKENNPEKEVVQKKIETKNRTLGHIGVFLTWSILLYFFGLVLSHFLQLNTCIPNILSLICIRYLLGFIFVNSTLWFSMAVFNTLNLHLIYNSIYALVGISILGLFIYPPRKNPSKIANIIPSSIPLNNFWKYSFYALAITIIVCIALKPLYGWDEFSHWIFKAKVLFHQNNYILEHAHHNYYPLLWPIHNATQFIILNETYAQIPQWNSAMMFTCFILILLNSTKEVTKHKSNYYIIALFAIILLLKNSAFFSATAENGFLAMTSLYLLAGLLFLRNQNSKRAFWFSLISTIGMTLIKFEGFITVCALSGSFILVHLIRKKPFSWLKIIILTSPILIEFFWLGYVKLNTPEVGLIHLQSHLSWEKVIYMIKLYPSIFTKSYLTFLFIIFILVLLNFRVKSKLADETLFLAIIVFTLCLFSMLANIGLHIDALHNAMHEAVPRLFYHAYPAIIMFLASWISHSKSSKSAQN